MTIEKSITVSISIKPKLFKRMNEYVVNKSKIKDQFSVYLSPYQFNFYKSIDKGKRSHVFSYIINDFLNVLEKNIETKKMFCSKNELIRSAIIYNRILKEDNDKIISNENPSGRSINGQIPIGNKHHPEGPWKRYHGKQDMLRYLLLEKIYRKVSKFYTIQQIVNNFEKFYKVYNDGLLDIIETEHQIRKLKLVIGK